MMQTGNVNEQKSGDGFFKKILRNNVTLICAVLILMIIIASIFSPYFLTLFNLQ